MLSPSLFCLLLLLLVIVWLVVTIFKRRQTEAELRREKDLVTRLVENSPVGVTLVDHTGCITFANEFAIRLFGLTRDELSARTYNAPQWKSTDFQGTSYSEEQLPFRRIMATGESLLNHEEAIEHIDGRRLYLKINAAPLRDAGGRVDGMVAIIEDVSTNRQREKEHESLLAELSQKNRELESIIFAASHDLRSPLVNILGFSSQLSEICDALKMAIGDDNRDRKEAKRLLEEEIPECLRYIQKSGSRMDALINGILKLSRTGRVQLTHRKIVLNDLVDSLVTAIHFQMTEAGATVTVEPLPACWGDPSLVSQVFANLLDNALKYRSPDRPPRIRVSGKIDQHEVIYCVEDNGQGIRPEHQARIWGLFSRLDPGSGVAGDGVGLALVRRILDRHQGRAWVESFPGLGSRFFVMFPLRDEEGGSPGNLVQ